MDDKAFESGTNGQKSLRVFLINPPISEPWRTRQDYIDDRNAAAESAERQKEAHQALMRQLKTQTRQMWIAFLAALIAAGALFVQTLQFRHEILQRNVQSTNASTLVIPAK